MEVGISPKFHSQAPYALVFAEQHISLVRIWLHMCECPSERPLLLFLASAIQFLCMASWAFPSLALSLLFV